MKSPKPQQLSLPKKYSEFVERQRTHMRSVERENNQAVRVTVNVALQELINNLSKN